MKFSEVFNKNNTILRNLVVAVLILVTLILTACSDGNDGVYQEPEVGIQTSTELIDSGPESLIVTGFDNDNINAISIWLVDITMYRLISSLESNSFGTATVDLIRYASGTRVSRHVENYSLELDVCVVNDPDAPPNPGSSEGEGASPPPTISGGESVVINTPSGPWYTLEKTFVDGQVKYTTDNGLPAELLPEGATLSIPGDEFPTVAAHPLYGPAAPERLAPDPNLPVAANSAYAWIPQSGKTIMRISINALDADNSFVDLVVDCIVRDSGSFTMPNEVTDFISTTPYRLEAIYTRVYNRLDLVNGIMIKQISLVGE